ncbi:hypothetical protein [Roseinatronobacter sp.]|nr:hypothetical protein [Roseibaca sp.]
MPDSGLRSTRSATSSTTGIAKYESSKKSGDIGSPRKVLALP